MSLITRCWLCVTLLLVSPAAHGSGGFVWNEHGFYIVDFLVFVWLLWLGLRKPGRAFLDRRHETARVEMDEAMTIKAAAEERLHRYEQALDNLEAEVEEVRASFRADGDREHDRIIDQAENDADRVRRDATLTLGRESAQLRNDIERDVATSAMARAEALIRERMDEAGHRTLIQAFIDDLDKRTDLTTPAA